MQITLEITPQAQAELSRQAAITGKGAEALAATLLEEALHVPALDPLLSPEEPVPFGRRLVDVFAKIQGLTDDVDFTRDPSPGRHIDLS